MSVFIAWRIMLDADKSIEYGKAKYQAYFVNTSIYQKYKDGVDTILTLDGFESCIVPS